MTEKKEHYLRNLTPEFRKEFLIKIGGSKGKEAILYNGLLALAHSDERFGHIQAYITQYPTKENGNVCFARAEIYNKEGNIVGMEEADASAANCGKMTAASFPRMALTRAKGRAFRDFLNVGMVTADEIADVYEEPLATSKQIGKIRSLSKELGWSKDYLADYIYDKCGTDILNELSIEEASSIIESLNASLDDDEDKIDFSE